MLKSYKILFSKQSIAYKICVALLALFILSATMRFSVHPSGGHTFRQADTIGMCIAFAEELKTRGLQGFDFLLYPRLLQKGLLDGINATEFPLLDVLGGFFFLGGNPWLGVMCTSLLILALNLWAGFIFLPRFLKFWNVEIPNILGVTLWLCGGSVAAQTTAIMPEGLAFPLIIMGMVLFLENGKTERIIKGVSSSKLMLGTLLCSLGMAVKPTTLIGMGAILPILLFSKTFHNRRTLLLLLIATSLAFPAWWYTVHARYVISFAQGPQIVPLAHLDPLGKLYEAGLAGIKNLLSREALYGEGQFPIYFGWFFIAAALAIKEYLLAFFYLIALIATISLDGEHLYQHAYYFIGAAAFSFPLMARVLGALQKYTLSRNIAIALIFWGLLYETRTNIWIWARDSQMGTQNLWALGTQARKIIPPTDHLVTEDGSYPQKMIFIGRSGTKMVNLPFEICNNSKYSRIPLTLVTDAPPPSPEFKCGGRSTSTITVNGSAASWYLTHTE
ncbi:MAG: hypothetical protein ABIQ95_00895 [Bdellovibrionia bacterium]